jgi:hypothetical protein
LTTEEATIIAVVGAVTATAGWAVVACKQVGQTPIVGGLLCPFQGNGSADVLLPPEGFTFNGRNNVGYKAEDLATTIGGALMVYAYFLGGSIWWLILGALSIIASTFAVWVGGLD